MKKMGKRVISNSQDIKASLKRIAKEIVKRNVSMEDVVFVGIRTGGAFLAKRLQGLIYQMGHPEPPHRCAGYNPVS